MTTGQSLGTCAALALVVAVCAACGSGLSGTSTCQDFMNASAADQQKVVNQLATKYHKPDYTTPLGAPEVPYYCSAHPDVTLDSFFQNSAG